MVPLGSLAYALVAHDPHAFQRGGAALTAIGALLIFWQLRAEAGLDRLINRGLTLEEARSNIPTEKLAAEIQKNRGHRLVSRARADRAALISLLAVITAFGEAIHGFGDLVVEALLRLSTC